MISVGRTKKQIRQANIAEIRRLCAATVHNLCAIEIELHNSGVLIGTEVMALGAQVATFRMLLAYLSTEFGKEHNPRAPSLQFKEER